MGSAVGAMNDETESHCHVTNGSRYGQVSEDGTQSRKPSMYTSKFNTGVIEVLGSEHPPRFPQEHPIKPLSGGTRVSAEPLCPITDIKDDFIDPDRRTQVCLTNEPIQMSQLQRNSTGRSNMTTRTEDTPRGYSPARVQSSV